MSDLKNEFSWSWSRHRTFSACLRRYWLQHYAFWGGWDAAAPPETREIYVQKQLGSRPQWVGTLVHRAAEWVLGEVRRGSYPPRERVVERFERFARQEIEDSARALYRVNPKRFHGFVEHYYQEPVGPDYWEGGVADVRGLVSGLFDNPVFLRLTRVPERIREVERLERVAVGGVPVWVSLDALVEDGTGGLVVIDWKTGGAHRRDELAGQLGVYAIYVLERYLGGAAPAGRVRTMYASLRDQRHEVFEVRPEDLRLAHDTVVRSAEEMRGRLVDVDANRAEEGDFPPLPEGAAACRSCAYRRSCGRDSRGETPPS